MVVVVFVARIFILYSSQVENGNEQCAAQFMTQCWGTDWLTDWLLSEWFRPFEPRWHIYDRTVWSNYCNYDDGTFCFLAKSVRTTIPPIYWMLASFQTFMVMAAALLLTSAAKIWKDLKSKDGKKKLMSMCLQSAFCVSDLRSTLNT